MNFILIMRGCLLGLWIIIILLTSGFLCFVRASVVTRSRGLLFILAIILIVITNPIPNAFSITFIIFSVSDLNCSSGRNTNQLF